MASNSKSDVTVCTRIEIRSNAKGVPVWDHRNK